MDTKTNLTTLFRSLLDALRDKESLVGDKALRQLAYFLVLKLIEPKLEDLDMYNDKYYDFDDLNEQEKQKLYECLKFSNLATSKENNLPDRLKFLWDYILSKHPKTKNIFLENDGFKIKRQSTLSKLIKKINAVDFSIIDADIQGEAYEEVIKDIMTGKVLGQFFTPPIAKQLMVELINPKLYDNGKIETIFDPAMGTGGFLITCLRHFIKKGKASNIKLDWDFISTSGLGGRETEPDTFKLAKSNMLINSGQIFDMLEENDSIRNIIKTKYDIILSNPPFGIAGLEYDEITDKLRNECMPIKSNSAVPLFLQTIMYILKINGRCAVVLPDGKELFSRNNELVNVRQYLMKVCDLEQIIFLPKGVFAHTDIESCIFYFVKKIECDQAVKCTVSYSTKTGVAKETQREYTFIDTHQTKQVKFSEYNLDNGELKELITASIDDIAKKNYSLNYMEYIKEDEVKYDDGIEVKTFGELCEFLPKSKRKAAFGKKEGKYPFYTSSQLCSKYCDEYDYDKPSLIIGTGGNANIKYGVKFSCSTDNFIVTANNDITIKYIYYYMLNNMHILAKGFMGVGLKHISKEYISNIKLPIPPLQRQTEIVQICEANDNLIKQLEQQIIQKKQFAKDVIDTIYMKNMADKPNEPSEPSEPSNLDNINSAKAAEQSDLDIIKKIKKIKKKKVGKSSDQDNINSANAAEQSDQVNINSAQAAEPSDLDNINSAKVAEQSDLDDINSAKATEQSDLDSIKKIKKIKKKKVINSANQ